jgi:3-dehydroquinate synthase
LVTKVTVTIPAGTTKTYDVHIGQGAVWQLGEVLAGLSGAKRATLISNDYIWNLVGDTVDSSLSDSGIPFDLIEIPEGEAHKTIETCQAAYEALTDFGAGRRDPIIAIGGGVIGDLAGFVAATYMRGAPFINVPTTLLAQVDSSIGGKTGVDLTAGKNLVGAFYQPMAVVSDTALLATLPDREVRCGLAEIIKCALLAGGEPLSFIEKNIKKLARRDKNALTEAVIRSVGFKAEIVSGDEQDLTGRRAVLNYGHTFGHALEAASDYIDINHGEAVAEGLRFAARLGEELGAGNGEIVETTGRLLAMAGFGSAPPEIVDVAGLMDAMRLDKKKTGPLISFVLLEDFGRPVVKETDDKTIMKVIKEIYG